MKNILSMNGMAYMNDATAVTKKLLITIIIKSYCYFSGNINQRNPRLKSIWKFTTISKAPRSNFKCCQ